MSNSPQKTQSFDSVISKHFQSFQGLIQSFFACHAGLFELQESEFKTFGAGMPGFLSTQSTVMGFEDIRYRAQVSLLGTALVEMRRLNVTLLEQTRRFLEIQKIAASNSSDEEKKAQVKKALESAPKTLNDLIENVSQLIPGGFIGRSELKSLILLERLLEMSIQTKANLPAATIPKARLQFARPDIKKSDSNDEKTAIRIVSVGLEIEPGTKLPIDPNFVRLVFFTAYSIGLHLPLKLKEIKLQKIAV